MTSLFLQFTLKELKLILSAKKTLLLCSVFIIYGPFLNYFSNSSYELKQLILPIYFIIAGCFPSEFSYSIMNQEYENKTYQIIAISKANAFMIYVSKIIIPSLFGLAICFISVALNEAVYRTVDNHIFHGFLTMSLTFFIFLSVIFTNLIIVKIFSLLKERMSKLYYSLAIMLDISVVIGFYIIFYYISELLALISLFILVLILFTNNKSIKNASDYFDLKIERLDNVFKISTPIMVLLKNSYIHTWNNKKSIISIFLTIFMLFIIKRTTDNIFILNLIEMIFYSYIANSIVFYSMIFDRRMKIIECYCLSRITILKLVVFRLIYPLIITSIFSLITIFFIYQNFDISMLIRLQIINLYFFLSLLSLAMYVNLQFYKPSNIIITSINLIITTYFIYNHVATIFLLILLSFSLVLTFYKTNTFITKPE